MAEKKHWKKLHNPDYLGAYSLLGKDNETLEVTVKRVLKKEVIGENGQAEECIVAELIDQKPMILNPTNCKIIEKNFNTPFIEDWGGKKMTIYVARVKAFGEIVEALRVVENPKKLPELHPKHKSWKEAKEAIKAGQYTIEQIRTKYSLTTENEKLLRAE